MEAVDWLYKSNFKRREAPPILQPSRYHPQDRSTTCKIGRVQPYCLAAQATEGL